MTAEETSHGPAKLVNPVGQTKSHQKWGARAGNAKTRRHPECRAACERPGHDGCYIVGSTPAIEIVGSSKGAWLRFFSAMRFSATVHPLKELPKISLASISCSFSRWAI